MSEKFEPYHQWLGIPANKQPPDCYTLLGIPLFEESPAVIENAADRQMAHLRNFQTGEHAAESQRLANEVAAARVRLLKPEKKAAYDQWLRQRISGPAEGLNADAIDPGLAAVFEARIPSSSGISSKGRGKKTRPKPAGFIAAAALIVAAVVLVKWVAIQHDSGPNDPELAKAGSSASPAAPPKDAAPPVQQPSKQKTPIPARAGSLVATGPKEEPEIAVSKSGIPKSAPEAAAQSKPQPQDDKEVGPASNDSPAERTEPSQPQAPAKMLALPSADEQKRLMGEIDEIYKPNGIKDHAAKAALARKLLEDGQKHEVNRAEQFVLLRRAGEIARTRARPT